MNLNKNHYAVIMAGGVGSRFWPMSKKTMPKQFHDLLGTGQTLIQKTFSRLAKIVPEKNIFILTNTAYTQLVKEEIPTITARQIIPEPAMRNTAPCILLAALKIKKENPNASMLVAPSDHWIEDEEAFAQDVHTAFKASQEDLLMTLGIKPTFPNTGYGYIEYNNAAKNPIKPVEKFTEKPDYQTARTFFEAGNYLWNAGIFIWKVTTILNAFQTHLPQMYTLFSAGESSFNTPQEINFINSEYQKAENVSIDYGIMEKARRVAVLPASFDWNDLGSWGSLYDKMDKNEEGNVIINARAYLEDAQNNIISVPHGKVVVIEGLSNYIIVENENILLIHPKEKEQEIKLVRQKVQEKFGDDLG